MIISDLKYLEVATEMESNTLEGGISLLQVADFTQVLKTVGTGVISGPTGVVIASTAVDAFTRSLGSLAITI